MKFRVQGLGLGVGGWCLGFRVWGSGVRVTGLKPHGMRVYRLELQSRLLVLVVVVV